MRETAAILRRVWEACWSLRPGPVNCRMVTAVTVGRPAGGPPGRPPARPLRVAERAAGARGGYSATSAGLPGLAG